MIPMIQGRWIPATSMNQMDPAIPGCYEVSNLAFLIIHFWGGESNNQGFF